MGSSVSAAVFVKVFVSDKVSVGSGETVFVRERSFVSVKVNVGVSVIVPDNV